MVFEFQRAHRMRHLFDRIRLAMGVIIHRIDAPRIPGTVVCHVQNSIHYRVSHVQIRRRHVDFCAECSRTIGEFPFFHALEQVEILLNGAVSVGAVFARLSQCPAIFTDLVRSKIANICFTRP